MISTEEKVTWDGEWNEIVCEGAGRPVGGVRSCECMLSVDRERFIISPACHFGVGSLALNPGLCREVCLSTKRLERGLADGHGITIWVSCRGMWSVWINTILGETCKNLINFSLCFYTCLLTCVTFNSQKARIKSERLNLSHPLITSVCVLWAAHVPQCPSASVCIVVTPRGGSRVEWVVRGTV